MEECVVKGIVKARVCVCARGCIDWACEVYALRLIRIEPCCDYGDEFKLIPLKMSWNGKSKWQLMLTVIVYINQ